MSNENEKIQAELAEYNADVEKAIAKFPERPHLPEQRLYTPLMKSASQVYILTLVVFNLLCIVVVSGQCVCMLVSPLLKNPTNVIVI